MRSTDIVPLPPADEPLPEQPLAAYVQPIWIRSTSNVATKLSPFRVLHVQRKHCLLGLIAEEGILVQIVRHSCSQVQLKAPGGCVLIHHLC